jgi:hypothetical protein
MTGEPSNCLNDDLAIPRAGLNPFFQEEFIQMTVRQDKINLIVYDAENQTIVGNTLKYQLIIENLLTAWRVLKPSKRLIFNTLRFYHAHE